MRVCFFFNFFCLRVRVRVRVGFELAFLRKVDRRKKRAFGLGGWGCVVDVVREEGEKERERERERER